ncbi:PTS sugar transporter subunit IIA [Spirochaetota bacterium]
MTLKKFFNKRQIIELKSTEKQHIIKELVEQLEKIGLIKNADRYYAQVIHRESLENTSIGYGFAIPHARTESLTELVSIIGISKEGVDYQSIDGKPVNYIMLSLFPTKLSTKYLYLIGMMARIFSNPDKRKLFDKGMTTANIFELLKSETSSYYNSISDQEGDDNTSVDNLSGVPSSDLDLLIRLDRLYKLYAVDTKSKKIPAKIDEIKELIDNRSLTYFERMRKKNSDPFAIVEKTSCSGCHMGIPPIDMKQISKQKGISVCSYCGRFLIIV